MFDQYKSFPLGMVPSVGSTADPNSQGYIYVIGFKEAEIIKIGSAWAPEVRLAELQCGCPFELSLLAVVSIHEGSPVLIEKAAHRLARESWIRGEWFELSVDEAIAVIIKAARNKKAKYTSVLEAHHETERRHTEAVAMGFAASEAARRAEIRRKLGMEEDA